MNKREDDEQPQVPNVSVDTVRPPAPSAGDLYSSATVLRQVPQELIEAARARRRGRAPDVPEAPPPPAAPSFDPFAEASDDTPSLEVGYADADDETLEGSGAISDRGAGRHAAPPGVSDLSGDDAPATPRAFAGFGGSSGAPIPPAPSSRPTLPGPDSVRMIPAGPSSRPTPVGDDPALELLARARPSATERTPPAPTAATSAPSAPPPATHRPPHDPDRAAEAETAPLAELDEERPAFMTVRPGARGALGAVGVLVMALLLAAAVLLAMRAFD